MYVMVAMYSGVASSSMVGDVPTTVHGAVYSLRYTPSTPHFASIPTPLLRCVAQRKGRSSPGLGPSGSEGTGLGGEAEARAEGGGGGGGAGGRRRPQPQRAGGRP